MATGIGETLREARQRQGASLAEAAAETRIREGFLAALEAEDFSSLGGDVYVKGFLRSYARFLGVDPEPLVAEYRARHEQPDELAGLAGASLPTPVSREPRQAGLLVLGAAAGLLLVVLAVIGFAQPDAEQVTQEAVAPAPTTAATEPTVAPTEAEPTEEPDDGVEVEVAVTGAEAWMRVVVDGDNVLEGLHTTGWSETFSADDVVQLRIGDPGAVTVSVNGEDQGDVGQPGIPIDLVYPEDAG